MSNGKPIYTGTAVRPSTMDVSEVGKFFESNRIKPEVTVKTVPERENHTATEAIPKGGTVVEKESRARTEAPPKRKSGYPPQTLMILVTLRDRGQEYRIGWVSGADMEKGILTEEGLNIEVVRSCFGESKVILNEIDAETQAQQLLKERYEYLYQEKLGEFQAELGFDKQNDIHFRAKNFAREIIAGGLKIKHTNRPWPI